jgi:hypothetical protein
MSEAKKKNENNALIDEEKIAGYTIRAWSFYDMAKLSPAFERITQSIVKRGIKLSEVSNDIDKIMFAILPELPGIVCYTLDITEDQLKKLSNENQNLIFLTLVKLNLSTLKNWFIPTVVNAIKLIVG